MLAHLLASKEMLYEVEPGNYSPQRANIPKPLTIAVAFIREGIHTFPTCKTDKIIS